MTLRENELHAFLYQKLLEMGDAMMQFYDCCHIEGGTCKAGPNPCCTHTQFGKGRCPFQRADGGCNFQNLDCKLWLCDTAVATTDPKCVEGLVLLQRFAQLFGLSRPHSEIGTKYVGADRQPAPEITTP